jgi:HEAT repeat protein
MNDFSSFPLIDRNDHEILMHRDAHFSGSFEAMLCYYAEEGKGVQPEFEIKRIKQLKEMEEKSQQNLSDIFLDEEEKEEVKKAKEKYLFLRELYEKETSSASTLIADLILTEDHEATKEIANIEKIHSSTLPLLIDLISQEDFYNPLFPGYGHAPAHAAVCLGKMKDPQAVPALFEALGRSDFFTEDAIMEALQKIGQPAKDFLQKTLLKEPFSKDNENAAAALLSFPVDESLSETFFSLLLNPSALKRPHFIAYLILGCEGLKKKSLQEQFKAYIENLPSRDAKEEASLISRNW